MTHKPWRFFLIMLLIFAYCFSSTPLQAAPSLKQTLQDLDIQPVQEIKKEQAKSPQSVPQQERIPDVIIRVDIQTLDTTDHDKLKKELATLRGKNKKMAYIDAEKLNSYFLFAYDSQADLAHLKNTLKTSSSIKVSPNRAYKAQYTPNDTYYSQQWNLTNINYSQAIDFGVGSTPVTVAIMDNGVNLDDADITNKAWINTGETPGDSIDNDGNAYIDDVNGCNFRANNCSKTSMDDASSSTRHGTYTAGVMGIETNNNLGIAGVCPTCKIMVLDIDDDNGTFLSDIIEAMNYAANKGAKVVNFSYGSVCPFDESEDILDNSLNTLVNTKNVSFVQAAGNNGNFSQSSCNSLCGSFNPYCATSARNEAYYYADGKSVPNKITVASIGQTNQRSSFSNFDGTQKVITIAAPGEAVPVNGTSSLITINGTSFSAPHVAGALGLALTKKDRSTAQLYDALISSADAISTDKDISSRKLNLYKFIGTAAARFPDVPITHIFYTFIENLAVENIVSGFPDGYFRPSDPVTRGAMAKFIRNAYGFADSLSCGNFSDVSVTHVFYKDITTLKCRGVISGFPDGTFKPEANVDRGAAMKFVMSGLRKKNNNDDYLRYSGSEVKFSDVPTSHVFYEYIMAAHTNAIVSGFPDGTFKPTATTDRGAMSKMVDNARNK